MLAYFDCFSGISGDMTLGALIDLGVPLDWLYERIRQIPLSGFRLSAETTHKNGIRAKNIFVDIDNHPHERNYQTITEMIHESPLSPFVKKQSINIFNRIAEAEAQIHGCPKEKVHFHEVGGIDAIVDIVGSALCVEYLGIKKIFASKIPVGKGFVKCKHGTLPVPAPATLSILEGVPIYGTEINHELVTPTGAAIITCLSESFQSIPDFIVDKIGYGAGKADIDERPNLLRVMIGKIPRQNELISNTGLVLMETCIDDMNPEFFGFLMDRLFKEGALDVYWIPVYMKKNRPGTKIQVLCQENKRETLLNRILSETTTLGVRYHPVERKTLARDFITIKTAYGPLRAKKITSPEGKIRIVPEYEVCKKIALSENLPISTVYDTIKRSSDID